MKSAGDNNENEGNSLRDVHYRECIVRGGVAGIRKPKNNIQTLTNRRPCRQINCNYMLATSQHGRSQELTMVEVLHRK